MKKAAFLACLLSLACFLLSCGRQGPPAGAGRLNVVTTLFPLYDFARIVGGGKAEVSLLLPPGVEPHSFEPKPADLVKIHRADIFIYTGDFMEPWAAVLVKGAQRPEMVVVDSSRGCFLLQKTGEHGGGGHSHGARTVDPHIWLDFGNARIMVDNILAAFVKKDPGNGPFYEKNAEGLKATLSELDGKFRKGLATCGTRLFVHGGHYAFNYLARRYGLAYLSVYGLTPDAEPSPVRMARIVDDIRRNNIKYVFYEELLQPRMAETIARETGARLLALNGGHNVTREELDRGVSFTSILEHDLENLKVGLRCR